MKKVVSIFLTLVMLTAMFLPVLAADSDSVTIVSLGEGYTEGGASWNHNTSLKYEGAEQGSYTTTPDAWCQYAATISNSGLYKVELYVVPTHSTYKSPSNVEVAVNFYDGTSTAEQTVDFYQTGGWIELGSYPFLAGTTGSVKQTFKQSGNGGPNFRAGAARFTYVGPAEETHNLSVRNFLDPGSWTYDSDYLQWNSGDAPAQTNFMVRLSGTYKVWCRSKNYAPSQATSTAPNRKFKVQVDENAAVVTGTHPYNASTSIGSATDGWWGWQEVGTYSLSSGWHNISIFNDGVSFVRCSGLFVTTDLNYVPTADLDVLNSSYPVSSITDNFPSTDFPERAKAQLQNESVVTMENEAYKIHFIQGTNDGETIVQNEIYVKHNGEWVKLKDKQEALGFLMMAAAKSEQARKYCLKDTGNMPKQTFEYMGMTTAERTSDFFKSGYPYWFIPNGVTKKSDKEVVLSFPKVGDTSLTATFAFDNLCADPKVTIQASFDKEGAYSFLLFSGDGFSESVMDTVTAPLLFNRKYVPEGNITWSEEFLTTPMVTYTVQDKVPGQLTTYGVAVDPSVIPQDVAYINTARFGFSLRDNNNNLRAQLCAPIFGTEASNFKAGDQYSFTYRILGGVNDWYDTYKHVAQDLYKVADIRSNYYASLNDAIFNTTDFMKDDLYAGWDKRGMGYYYSESREDEGHTNYLLEAQRYLLTEDETLLEERVVPTIAFMLSRGSSHFTRNFKNPSAVPNTKIVAKPNIGTAADYLALYEMSQGRMTFFKQLAADKGTKNDIPAKESLYHLTGDAANLDEMRSLGDKVIATTLQDDSYMKTINRHEFVLGDYTSYIDSLLIAYETLGDKKYLDAAEKLGRMLLTSLSTKGYQNDYAENVYHVDPQPTADAHVVQADNAAWYWHGAIQWRRGFPYGETGPLAGTVSQIHEEDVPGWLPAVTGLSTEHPRTPGHSNFITMNAWAAQLVKLSQYTGDDFFETQARNAFIGRYSSYPGYYIDRYWTNYMKKEYPYEGPEYNINYYTHTSSFLSMLEDFLITEAWSKSGGSVEFPHVSTNGYAYFTSKQYGHEPGKMYEEDGLWLWNDKGILSADDVNVDFVAGRKQGVLGLALMNEKNSALTSVITLGEKVPNFTGTAVVYDKSGMRSTIPVTNGTFSITIPAKGIQTVILYINGIQAPSYAAEDRIYSTAVENTMSSHTNGKGYVIQFNDNAYYAYIYLTDKDLDSLTVDYTVNGKSVRETISEYPFETIIKVDNPDAALNYKLTANKNGVATNYGSGVLKPVSCIQGEGAVTVNGNAVLAVAGAAKAAGAAVAETDKNGDAITRATVLDAVYTAKTAAGTTGRWVISLNGKPVPEPDVVYVQAGDAIQAEWKTDGFAPLCFGKAGTIIGNMGGKYGAITKGQYKFTTNNRTELAAIIPNLTTTDSMKGLHLNGVLTAAEGKLGAPAGQKWNGYILFDNIEIVQSGMSNGSRLDFSFNGIEMAKEGEEEKSLVKNEAGEIFLNPKMAALNLNNIYETDALYLTDKYTKGGISVFDNGTHTLITTDGTVDCYIIVATYGGAYDSLQEVSANSVILTFNEPYIVPAKANQKIFIWKNVSYSGTNMSPLLNVLER